jgi:hypothetical protein
MLLAMRPALKSALTILLNPASQSDDVHFANLFTIFRGLG